MILKMLNKQKLESMIREYLKIPNLSREEMGQFSTLMKAYESCEKSIPTLVKLAPPKVINIPQVKKIFVIKDVSMGACISEMQSNAFFLKQQIACEVC